MSDELILPSGLPTTFTGSLASHQSVDNSWSFGWDITKGYKWRRKLANIEFLLVWVGSPVALPLSSGPDPIEDQCRTIRTQTPPNPLYLELPST